MQGPELTFRWAATLVDTLVQAGVRHAVVSPGSRSAPLALCLAERSELKVWPIPDERSAAFFALGIGMATGTPAVFSCTSGTAGANAYPAVIEASLSGVPLVVVTADRPPELHGFGALQTIDQHRLFGGYAEGIDLPAPDAAAFAHLRATVGRALSRARVVHLNVPLREPLAHEGPLPAAVPGASAYAAPTPSRPNADAANALLSNAPRIVVLAGPARLSTAARDAVASLGAPIFAEASSGFRFGPHSRNAVAHYESLLRAATPAPDVILRVGGPLTTRVLQGFVDRTEAKVLTLAEPGRVCDPTHRSTLVLEGDTAEIVSALRAKPDPRWLEQWLERDAAAGRVLAAHLATEGSEPAFARAVLSAMPSGSNLMVSNSMPIRDADAFASKSQRQLEVFASRGASGIDGVTSTAFGIAAATGRKTALLIGDTALLHDAGGLLWGSRLGLSLCIVTVNNAGGRIFEMLPVAQTTKRLGDLFVMPPDVELNRLAALAKAGYARVTDAASVERAVMNGLEGGVHLIELDARSRDVLADHKAAWAAVAKELPS
jgi:2-succinyl-5-enolpyruvyl-6-hydroxy-3-cyclohexene-1-carboxylate synthase